jgi:hypothetical protein
MDSRLKPGWCSHLLLQRRQRIPDPMLNMTTSGMAYPINLLLSHMRAHIILPGDPSSLINLLLSCWCPLAFERYQQVDPPKIGVGNDHSEDCLLLEA